MVKHFIHRRMPSGADREEEDVYVMRALVDVLKGRGGVNVLKSKDLLHRVLVLHTCETVFSSVVSFQPFLFCCCVIDGERSQVLAFKKDKKNKTKQKV